MDKRLGAYGGEHLLKGGQLIFVVYNDRTAHSLTLEKMLKGISKYIQESDDELLDGNKLDMGCIDSMAADTIIQYSLFGEVVYD